MKKFYEKINETRENMAADCMKTYDRILEQCLEPYGINKVNAMEHADRVVIEEVPPTELDLPTYKRFYIDGVYAFTITEKAVMDFESRTFKMECEKILEQDRVPMTDEEAIVIISRLAMNSGFNGDVKTLKALNRAMDALNERVQPKKVSVEEESDRHETKSPDWIYQNIPLVNFEIDFDAIEKALGFKLFYWQKTYIAYGHFRQYGQTTARILRDLFDPNLMDVPIDYSRQPISFTERLRRENLREIKEKLNKAGVKTRKIKTPSGEIY